MSDTNITPNIRITATDDSGPTLQAFAQRIKDVSRAAQGAMSQGLTGETKKFGYALEDVRKVADTQIGQGVTGAFDKAGEAAGGLIQRLAGATALEEFARRGIINLANVERGMERIKLSAGANDEQMKSLGGSFEEWAKISGSSIVELQGHFEAFRNISNLSLSQTHDMFGTLVTAAEVTGASVDGMGKIAAAAMNNLKMSAGDVKEMLSELTIMPGEALNAFAERIPRLSQALSAMNITGASAKQSMIDFAASFNVVSAATGQPRIALSEMNNLLQKAGDLTAPLGVMMKDSMAQIRASGGSVLDIYKAIGEAIDKMNLPQDTEMRNNILRGLGLDENAIVVLGTIRNSMGKITDEVARAASHAGVLTEAWLKMSVEARASISAIVGALETLGMSFGGTTLKILNMGNESQTFFRDVLIAVNSLNAGLLRAGDIISIINDLASGNFSKAAKDWAAFGEHGYSPKREANAQQAADALARNPELLSSSLQNQRPFGNLSGRTRSVETPPAMPGVFDPIHFSDQGRRRRPGLFQHQIQTPDNSFSADDDADIPKDARPRSYSPLADSGAVAPSPVRTAATTTTATTAATTAATAGGDVANGAGEATADRHAGLGATRENTDAIKGLTEKLTFGYGKTRAARTAAFTPGAGEMPTPAEAGVPIRGSLSSVSGAGGVSEGGTSLGGAGGPPGGAGTGVPSGTGRDTGAGAPPPMGRRQVAPGGPGANQSVGGQGAITGSVHGHPVEAYGPPELAGQTLHDPITATSLGGGLGGTSAKFGANMHEGIDLMAPVGAPVYASKSGTIVRAPKPGGGTDQVLTIKHDDGVYSRYLHQGPASVKEGDVVAGGQQIGTSGYRNAAHTHFEMWHGTPGGRDSKLMNARAIYGWNKGNLPQGGRAMTAMGPGGQGQPAVAGGRPAPATASLTPPTADTPSAARGSPDGGQGQPPVAGEGQSSVTKGSFYDTGAQTSTGERFDPEGYTAAIRQSDRNQWGGVRAGGGDQWADVTDQNTGKTVRVRVNDVMGKRDPQDRGIDLSRGSMRALDPSLKSGVLPNLKVTRLPPGKYSGGPVNAEAVSKSAQAGTNGNKRTSGWDQGAADERISGRERQLKEQGAFESGYPDSGPPVNKTDSVTDERAISYRRPAEQPTPLPRARPGSGRKVFSEHLQAARNWGEIQRKLLGPGLKPGETAGDVMGYPENENARAPSIWEGGKGPDVGDFKIGGGGAIDRNMEGTLRTRGPDIPLGLPGGSFARSGTPGIDPVTKRPYPFNGNTGEPSGEPISLQRHPMHDEFDALEKRRRGLEQPIKMHIDAPSLPPHYESAWRRSAGKQQQKYINDSISRNERTAFGASALDYGLG